MPSLSAARAANAAFSPKYLPVALFVGGTSGIGQAMAESFARYTKGNARIIICGRNEKAANAVIATFPKPTVTSTDSDSGSLHEFVPCDAVLMKNVHATTTDLLARLPKINFLVLSPGFLTLKGRDETEEGIDKKLALNYYARWKFIKDMMPLLRKAKDADEDAKVMTVLAAGTGGAIDLNDFGLKKNYSVLNAGLAVPTYNDLMLEEFSAQQPDLAFTHIYPGIVRTPMTTSFFKHPVLSPVNFLMNGLLYPVSVAPGDCAEYMLHALLDGERGFFRKGPKGDDLGKKRYFSTDEARKKLWEHTVAETQVAS